MGAVTHTTPADGTFSPAGALAWNADHAIDPVALAALLGNIQGQPGAPGLDGEQGAEGEKGVPGVQGPIGLQGTAGNDGVPGQQGPQGLDGNDGIDGADGPQGAQGLQGIQGVSGAIGPQGPIGFGIDGADGQDGNDGPPGAQGVAGATGSTGPVGPQGGTPTSIMQGEPGEDALPFYGVPTGLDSRSNLGPDAKNWAFLGTISGTGVTVGPLIWTGQFQQIYFEYIIGGYNGGTPVGRLLCGSAAISTTALTNGNKLLSDGTSNATSINVPGCPLAVTLSAIARQGRGWISGASGSLKQIDIIGKSGNPAVGTSPTSFSACSFFSDLGTNLLIQRLQLTVYDTLITTAASAQTFTATTQLWAWGRFND